MDQERLDNQNLWQNLKKFARFFYPYRFRTVGALFITIPVGVLDAVIAWILRPFMDEVMLGGGDRSLSFFPVLIVVFALVQSAFNYAATYLNTWVGRRVSLDVKQALFEKLMHSDAGLFDTATSGTILQRYSTDADIAGEDTLSGSKLFVTRVVSSMALIAVLFYNSWILALIAVGALSIAAAPLGRVRKRIKQIVKDTVAAGAVVTTHYNEVYGGNRVIASYNLYDFQMRRIRKTLNELFRLSIKMVQRTGSMSIAMHFATAVGIAATVWLQGYLISTNHITPGNFVSFMTALLMLYTPMKNISKNFSKIQTSLMAMGRVLDRLEDQPAIVSKPDAPRLETVERGIRYENVSFEYVPGKPVLRNINLEVPAGRSFAFVGNSGGGKTTLVNLLPRFYDATAGRVTVDGHDVRDLDLASLRDRIAIVFQDNFLFGGSIRDNILLGKENATEDELEAAVRAACLDGFVAGLEHGYDTQIGERGVMLSGGQKQRVAIARAFIKNAPVVILDEATSALDNQSETVVQQAIENLMHNKTVLIIAHRLSTVVNCDAIVVLKDGVIAEIGKHEELIAANGVYASLYKTQLF